MQRATLTASRVASAAAKAAPACSAASSRAASTSLSSTAYNVVFKRNVTYISYIVVGAVVLDAAYGSTLDSLWSAKNRGVSAPDDVHVWQKCTRPNSGARSLPHALAVCLMQRTFETTDWTKFKAEDDE